MKVESFRAVRLILIAIAIWVYMFLETVPCPNCSDTGVSVLPTLMSYCK